MSKRPPADKMPNEIFFDKKCGQGPSHDKLFNWCAETATAMQKVTVNCSGITGIVGDCESDIWFDFPIPKKNLTTISQQEIHSKPTLSDDNTNSFYTNFALLNNSSTDSTNSSSTNTTTTTPAPPASQDKPEVPLPNTLNWDIRCPYGPGKVTSLPGSFNLSPDLSEKIITFCHQQAYGVDGWPLWLILLVIGIIVVALTAAGSLFWRYYLRRKVYGPQPGEAMSTMGSQWTSAPISSVSGYAKSGSQSSRAMPSSSQIKNLSRASNHPSRSSRLPSVASSRKPSAMASQTRSLPKASSNSGSLKVKPSGRSSLSGASPSRSKYNR